MSWGVPLATSWPASNRWTTSQRLRTAARSWLTSRIARPRSATSSILSRQLTLELLVADREHLVDDQHLGFEMCRDREAQPHLHAAREVLHGCVDEALDAGELDDRVELAAHLDAAHPEDRSREEDVLSPREIDVKAGADFEQRADPPADLGPAFGRHRDARQELEQRALPRAVATDDPGHLSGHDLEVDVA